MPGFRHIACAILTGGVFTGGVVGTTAAHAGEDHTRDSIRFEASGADCPTESAFLAEARQRRPARSDPTRRLDVTLRPSERGFEGTVEAFEGDGDSARRIASRTVEGESCQDVASAALLLVALASLDAVGSPPSPDAPSPNAPLEALPSSGAPERGSRLALHVAGLGAFLGGLGPLAAGGGGRVGLGVERQGLVRPEIRAGIDVFASADLENVVGTARRSLIAARVDLCPIGVGPERITARLCAAGALGEIRVRGVSVINPRDEGRLYAALGGLGRLRLHIAGGLSAELSGGVMAALLSHRFFFEPDATLLRTDSAIAFGEGGIAWSIP